MTAVTFGRGSRRHRGPSLLVALVVATTAACASDDSREQVARPPAPEPAPVIRITMVDHRFELGAPVPAGRVVFEVENAGQSPHNLVMIPLPEDVPPIDVQLRGSERRLVEPFAGVYERAPGDTGTFAVDLLAERRYALICTVSAEDGQPHWMQGMATEFRTATARSPGDGG